MSIESRIRILWGALGLLVTLLLLSLAYGATAVEQYAPASATSSNEPDYGPVVRANLSTISWGIFEYRMSHADKFPPKLSMLYPTYISDPSVFWNPGDDDPCPTTIDNDEPDQPNSTQVSFLYLQPWGDQVLILQDNSAANNQYKGLYALNYTSPSTVVFFKAMPSPPPWTQISRTNLQQLGLALSAYAVDNTNQYPDRLSRLYPQYVSDPLVFWNAGGIAWYKRHAPQTIDNDVPGGANSAQISYAFLGANKATACPAETILLQDRWPLDNGGAIISTLTADMVVTTWVDDASCIDPLTCHAPGHLPLWGLISAMQTYATENGDEFPTRLSMLYGHKVHHPGFFWSHGDSDPRPLVIDNDAANQTNSAQVSYAYFKTSYANLNVVLHDNTLTNNAGEGVHVATRDGTTRFFKRSDRMLPSTALAKSHLLQLGQALKAYAASNDGRYPQLLSSLYPAYIADPAAFWNPGDKDACPTSIDEDGVNRSNSAQVSFNYLGAPYREGDDPGIVLLADNSLANNGGTGILVLTADYLVDYFAPTFPSRDEAMVCANIARSNLRKVYYALRISAYDDRGRLPPTLSALQLQREPLRPSDFWNPGDADEYPLIITNDVLDHAESAQISFEYLAGGEVLDDLPPGAVLVQDNTPANNSGDGKLVLRADGHIDFEYMRRVASLSMIGPETIPENGTAAYTCTASFDDGTVRDVTGESEWSMIRALGYFEGPGAYRAVLPVSADTPTTLRVQYVDQGGAAFDAQKTIIVQNTVRVLTDLAITAGPATVGEGETAAYTCTATYDDGGTQDVTAQAVWSVSSGPGSFSSAGTYAAPATVTADTPATIRASFSHDGVGKEVTKDITVLNTKRILTGLSIVSGPNSVAEGGSAAYACRATYDDGTFEDATATAAWSVTVGPGSFSAAGTYHAPATVLADTPATLRASYSKDGVTRQATKNITVLNSVRILASLSISSGPAVVPEGGTGVYACTAVYDDGTTQTVTTSAAWTVTAGPGAFTSPGTYAAPASVTANTAVTLEASYTETGVTKSTAKSITVSNGIRRLSSVTIGSGPATVGEGGSGAYTCTAVYDDGTTQDVTTSATWYLLENVGEFLVPGTYTAPASVLADRPVAIHVIYAEGGLSRQASKSITVLNSVRRPAELAISSSPAEVAEGGGADLVCTVTYDDGGTEDVTDAAVWTVTEGPGAFTAPGTYAAPAMVLADTAVKVTAAYGEGGVSKHATAQFTVRNSVRMLASLAVTSGPATLTAGATGNFVCAATYDDGSTRPVTNAATWSIVSGSGSFAIGGVYTAPAPVASALSVTIKAAYAEGGITREASRSLRVDPPPAADADGDGVADPNDACPFTPAGAAVDANGCAASQRDSDGDGVSDDRDACPGTPAGTTVQSNGCPPPDRDFDGIADLLDNCPNNANPGQQDADRDGRGDACDACPGDPAKTSPGACGCGVPETADCGAAAVYTVRIITPSGSSSPGTFAADTWADIAAPAAPEGMRFAYWSGDHSGTESIARVFMDADKELIANYEDCPEAPMPPCGAGTTACGLTSLLALALLKRRRSS